MSKRERERHWYIVRNRGEREIRCLLSAFSEDHLRRKTGFEHGKDVVIQEAKRWHIVRVFSGSPVFYEYALQAEKYRNMGSCEDVNAHVENEFHTEMDGEKILVKVLS